MNLAQYNTLPDDDTNTMTMSNYPPGCTAKDIDNACPTLTAEAIDLASEEYLCDLETFMDWMCEDNDDMRHRLSNNYLLNSLSATVCRYSNSDLLRIMLTQSNYTLVGLARDHLTARYLQDRDQQVMERASELC